MTSARPTLAADRGDIVLGWLTKLTVTMAVLGLLLFDGISLAVGRFQAEDRAHAAASAGLTAWNESRGDVQRAYEAAVASLPDPLDDTIAPESFSVADDGTVTLTLQHTSSTFVVEKVSALRHWATATATVSARPAR